MPTFSLKTLLALVFLAGIASYTLTRPSITAAVVLVLATVLCLFSLTVLGLRKRRSFAVVLACLCACYLGVADGGIFPEAERLLPTEWLLNHSTTFHTRTHRKLRSDSLMKWTWRVCVEKNHQDRSVVMSSERMPRLDAGNTSDADTSHSSTKVKLPAFTFTPVTGTRTSAKRDAPLNRTFFIVGHCWCVISIVLLTLLIWPALWKR